MSIIFYISSAIALISTFMAISGQNPVHSLLFFITSLLAVAFVFFALGSPFAAALEIIIYAGAVMVLFIFVIMMLNAGSENRKKLLLKAGFRIPSIFILILFAQFLYVLISGKSSVLKQTMIGPEEVGISLYGVYILGVELAGLLLLAGIVAAYHIGRSRKKSRHRFFQEAE